MPEVITEFFDPYNDDHIMAYIHLQNYGHWPNGFIDDNMIFPPAWHMLIASKLADAWVRHRKENIDA